MISRFLNVVPKSVQLAAKVILGCAVLIGLVVGYYVGQPDAGTPRSMLVGASVALLGGIMTSTWLLCLGYVYADARRRAMKAVLWTAFAVLCPHLLGFLLYFVMRQPIASTCLHCGSAVPLQQPFCSWCGSSQSASMPSGNESRA